MFHSYPAYSYSCMYYPVSYSCMYHSYPCCHLVHAKIEKEPNPKPKSAEKGGYRIRMGKWEEVYDPVDGTKTWYNTVTEKTTKKDPFV